MSVLRIRQLFVQLLFTLALGYVLVPHGVSQYSSMIAVILTKKCVNGERINATLSILK